MKEGDEVKIVCTCKPPCNFQGKVGTIVDMRSNDREAWVAIEGVGRDRFFVVDLELMTYNRNGANSVSSDANEVDSVSEGANE